MIIRNHAPSPRTLTPTQRFDLEKRNATPSGIGDQVEKVAKPIARQLNRIGPKIERLGRWLSTIGQPGSACGCQSRKACLNQIAVDLKHPFKTLSEIFKCLNQ